MSKTDQIALIEQYLANPTDFSEGLALYQRFGTNKALKTIFSRSGATAYNHQKLNDALAAITGSRPKGAAPRLGRGPKARPIDPRPRWTPLGRHRGAADGGPAPYGRTPRGAAIGQKPENNYAVPVNHPELVKRYRQRAMWKSQLTLLPTQEERRERAFAILDLTDEIEGILYNGFPRVEKNIPDDRAALARRLVTNRKYISKFRDRADKETEINRRKQENTQIETILGAESPS